MEEKILVTKSSMPDYDEYCKMIKPLWDSHWLTNNGSLHKELEQKLKKYLNVDNITLFTNGHLALESAIKAFDFPKGSEVITTPFTFISTTHAIARNGLVPVFCDIKKDDYTIDPKKIEELITDKTVAILPVHVYGNVCDVESIDKIAKKHNLKVIYDAAHAFGEKYNNNSVLNYGDISMLSFHATKVFNTIEGGALIYKDSTLESKLNSLKNFGIVSDENIDYIAGNAKMNEFQAAMGICNLNYIDKNINKRKNLINLYKELLKDVLGVKFCDFKDNIDYNYSYFPILVDTEYGINRDELYHILITHNIFSRKYFYPISNETKCYKQARGLTPIAKNISKRILTLPLYADLSEDDVKRICSIIKERR